MPSAILNNINANDKLDTAGLFALFLSTQSKATSGLYSELWETFRLKDIPANTNTILENEESCSIKSLANRLSS